MSIARRDWYRDSQAGPEFLGCSSVMETLMLERHKDKDAQLRLIPPGVM